MNAATLLNLLTSALALFDRLADMVDDLEDIRDADAVDWDSIDEKLDANRARLAEAIARRRSA
jgi:hypothetical protein